MSCGYPPPVDGLQLSNENFPLPSSTYKGSPNFPRIQPYLPTNNANSLKIASQQSHNELGKEILMVGGILYLKWTKAEVERMTHLEELQFDMIGMFTYDKVVYKN